MLASLFCRIDAPGDEILSMPDLLYKIRAYYTSDREGKTLFDLLRDTNKPETRISISLIIFLSFICAPIITRLVFGCAGFVISYQIYYKYGAQKAGDQAWGMLKTKNIHIHHWLYCLVSLVVAWIIGLDHPFLVGLCSGGIAHGVQFSDWHRIKA